jgi:hypothetical protein
MQFQKATKKKAKLRMALVGPSGAGKTYTALAIATSLGQRVALIDTERGSASKYAGDPFQFDALDLETFAPQQYIDAIEAAAKAGYEVLVIDSLTHAWSGVGGALEQVDSIAKRSQSKNTFAAWRDVTPQHNALINAIIRAPMHVLVTMRAKTEYVMEKDERTGRTTPRKIGIQPDQRSGMEYEFDVVGDVDVDHNFMVSKTRCKALDGKVYRHAGADVASLLATWLTDGVDAAPWPVADAEPNLAPQLAASVQSNWPAWVAKHDEALRNAAKKSPGALAEAWAAVAADIKKLSPPSEHAATLKATKDALKNQRVDDAAAQ